MEQKRLNVNREKFACEFVLTGIAAQAYRTAYPNSLKWKDKTVYSRASELLADSEVQGRVTELRGEIKVKFDISAERLLLEQSRIALFDSRRLWDESGRLILPQNFPDDVAAVVSSVKISRIKRSADDEGTEDVIEVKLWNKNNSLDSLFKNKGLYETNNAQKRPMVIIKDFSGGE